MAGLTREEQIGIVKDVHDTLEEMLHDLITLYSKNYEMDLIRMPRKVDTGDKNIWMIWLQGREQAPELVEACIRSVERYKPDGYTIRLLSLDNIDTYVTVPEYIRTLLSNPDFPKAVFTDFVRSQLLYLYGGIWMDATYFVTQKMDFADQYSFFTLKQKYDPDPQFIANDRWTTNFMKAEAGNILYRFVTNAFCNYFMLTQQLINYYLIDFLIDLAYNHIEEVGRIIDQVPLTNPHYLQLLNRLSDPFDADYFKKLQEDTSLFKLTYRGNLLLTSREGQDTYYKKILEQFKEDS